MDNGTRKALSWGVFNNNVSNSDQFRLEDLNKFLNNDARFEAGERAYRFDLKKFSNTGFWKFQ